MHYLSVAAIIKNESLYIKEWLEFYIKQGVEHFYLFDNESTDATEKVTKPYVDKGLVTWESITGTRRQLDAYRYAFKTYLKETVFCAFLDGDEFLYSVPDKKFIDTLNTRYDLEDISGIAVHWLSFGSSGHLTYSSEDVTKRFIKRGNWIDPHVKSILRLADVRGVIDPHAFSVKGKIVTENFKSLPRNYSLHEQATANVLRVNHYVTKSKQECAERRGRIRADTGRCHGEDFFTAHDVNDVEDKDIWRVL